MAHPEDLDPENEFLKEEKKKDPMEFAKEYMEFASEYMNEMKEAKKRRDEGRAADAASGESFLTAPVGLRQWRPRLMITFTIQQIENGFVVLRAHDHGAFPVTEYAPDSAGVKAIVDRETEAFLGTCRPRDLVFPVKTPPPEAGKGLPPGSSPGMTRVEGPPPVSGPLEAPEGPLGPLEP